MSTRGPDGTTDIDSVPAAEVSDFDGTDDTTSAPNEWTNGSIAAAFRPAQRFHEVMNATDE